jgi:hypothetical protein
MLAKLKLGESGTDQINKQRKKIRIMVENNVSRAYLIVCVMSGGLRETNKDCQNEVSNRCCFGKHKHNPCRQSYSYAQQVSPS